MIGAALVLIFTLLRRAGRPGLIHIHMHGQDVLHAIHHLGFGDCQSIQCSSRAFLLLSKHAWAALKMIPAWQLLPLT